MSDWAWIENAPMYDEPERIALWYFNWRLTFLGHPEARIAITADGRTVVSWRGRTIIDRRYGLQDIDLNNWIGRSQAECALQDYKAAFT